MIGCFEALRLLMAFVLTFLHLNWHLAPRGYLMVEGFFAISGFFIAMKNETRGAVPLKKLVLDKLIKLYPTYFVSFLFLCCMKGMGFIGPNILYFLTLTYGLWYRPALAGVGFWPIWFVSVYFWVYIAASYLTSRIDKKYYIAPMLVGSLAIAVALRILSPSHGINIVADYEVLGFSVGLLRGIMGVSFGVLSYEFCKIAAPYVLSLPNILFSAFETIVMGGMVYIISFSGFNPLGDYVALILWPTLIICFYFRKGWISRSFDWFGSKYPRAAGLSYPIFLIHYPIADHPVTRAYFTDHILYYEITVIIAALILQKIAALITKPIKALKISSV